MPASESSSGATAVVAAADSSAATHDHLSAEIFSHTEQEAAWACEILRHTSSGAATDIDELLIEKERALHTELTVGFGALAHEAKLLTLLDDLREGAADLLDLSGRVGIRDDAEAAGLVGAAAERLALLSYNTQVISQDGSHDHQAACSMKRY